jgi:hypothetical protein
MSIQRPQAVLTEPFIAVHVPGQEPLEHFLHRTSKYYLADLHHQDFGSYAEHVDTSALPPWSLAVQLTESYFSTVHTSFPIIIKERFMSEMERFWVQRPADIPYDPWRASLNLVFAIGALYYQRADIELENLSSRDHVLFFLRARLLTLEPPAMVGRLDLTTIQMVGLQGIYFACSHQVNRAWMITGHAIRSAHVQGLHLPQDVNTLTDDEIEFRNRLRHSIDHLEQYLSLLTGRPMSSHLGYTPVPLLGSGDITKDPSGISYQPDNSPVDEPVDAFKMHTALDALLSQSMDSLYLPEAMNKPWATTQTSIQRLNLKLGKWRSSLPTRFLINEGPVGEAKAPLIERMSLNCRYFSTSMLINRFCVYDAKRASSAIPSQSQASKEGDQKFAQQCINSALGLVNLFAESPNAIDLYRTAPWWSILHFITQAGAILTMEVWCHFQHDRGRAGEIVSAAIKVVDWLSDMSRTDLAAENACLCLSRLLRLGLSQHKEQTQQMDPALRARIEDFRSIVLSADASGMDMDMDTNFNPSTQYT